MVAAGHHFARHGYSSVRLADIADDVGITPAMIVRYFGSKRSLFDAVVDPESVDAIRGRSSPREWAMRTIEYWQDPDLRTPVLALIRSLEVDDGQLLRAALDRRVVAPLTDVIHGEDADVRLRIASSLGLGFGLFTLGILLDPDRPPLPPEEVERYVPYLTNLFAICFDLEETPPTPT